MSAPTTSRPSGGSTKGRTALTGTQTQLVIAAAHKALTACGIEVGPSRVARIVHKFKNALRRCDMTFHEYLSDEANLSASQRRFVLNDPDLASALMYRDPTGEIACNHVMHERARA